MQLEIRAFSKHSRFVDIFVDQTFVRKGAKRIFKQRTKLSFPTQKTMQDWMDELELKGAREYAYSLLSYQSYPSAFLQKKMYDLKIDLRLVQKVIEELTNLGYLNDKEWIQRYIEKLLDKGWGPYVIVHKLKAKNIQASLKTVEVVATIEKQMQAMSAYMQKRKINHSYLVRRGFSISAIEHWQESRNFL